VYVRIRVRVYVWERIRVCLCVCVHVCHILFVQLRFLVLDDLLHAVCVGGCGCVCVDTCAHMSSSSPCITHSNLWWACHACCWHAAEQYLPWQTQRHAHAIRSARAHTHAQHTHTHTPQSRLRKSHIQVSLLLQKQYRTLPGKQTTHICTHEIRTCTDRASLHEAHRMSLSVRAKHWRQRSSLNAGNSTNV